LEYNYHGPSQEGAVVLANDNGGFPLVPSGAALGHDAVYSGSILNNPSQDALEVYAGSIIAQADGHYSGSHVVTARYTGVQHGAFFGGPTHEAINQERRAEYNGVALEAEDGRGYGSTTVSVDGDPTTYHHRTWARPCKWRLDVRHGVCDGYDMYFVLAKFDDRGAALRAESALAQADLGVYNVPSTNRRPLSPGKSPKHKGDHAFVYQMLRLAPTGGM
jgi:hypothetical protein